MAPVPAIAGSWRGWLAAILAVTIVAVVGLSWHRYAALEREFTEAALARHAAIGSLAASTLAVKFERLIDVGVALATRVRFQELVAAGRWSEAGQILQRVPQDFDFIDRLFLTDAQGTLLADVPQVAEVRGKKLRGVPDGALQNHVDRPLGAADLAGLPLPEKAWDDD